MGAVARVLDEQKPVFIPDLAQEMLKHPDLAPFAPEVVGRSTYLFPVSSFQKRFGILSTPKLPGQQFAQEDVELLGSLASHVAVALECAFAKDRAEQYQPELASERDRLRLVLEINNHVAKLDINDVLRSASASIRSYFVSDFTAFWILDKDSSELRGVGLEFPIGKGAISETASADLTADDYEKLRARGADILTTVDFGNLPASLARSLRAESISCHRLLSRYRSRWIMRLPMGA